MLTGSQNLIVEIGQRNNTQRDESVQKGFFFLSTWPIQIFLDPQKSLYLKLLGGHSGP